MINLGDQWYYNCNVFDILVLGLPHRDYQDFRILKNIVLYLLCVHTTAFLATLYSRYLHLIYRYET